MDLRSKLKTLVDRKASVLNAYLDKIVAESDYVAKCQELDNEMVAVRVDLAELERKLLAYDVSTLERIKNAFLEPKQLKDKFLSENPETQRNVLFTLLWNAEVANKKIVNITYKQPYDAMANLDNKDDFSSMRRERDSNSR